MPVRKLFVLMCAAVAMGVAIPLALKKAGYLGEKAEVKAAPLNPEIEIPIVPVAAVAAAPVKHGEKPPDVYPMLQAKPVDAAPEKPLFVRGIAWKGKKLRVLLSDGRTLTESDDVVVRADSSGVTLKDGTRIWSEQIRPKEVAPMAVPFEKESVKSSNQPGVAASSEMPAIAAETGPAVPPYVPIPRTARSGNGAPRSGARSAPPSLVRGADNVTSNAR